MGSHLLSAQNGQDIVASQNQNKSNQFLFVTTDKTLYLPGEVIWFAGYLLAGNIADSLNPDILSVSLVNEQGLSVLRKNYLMTKGLCSGSLTLPDYLIAGRYTLTAYSNIVNDKQQPLHIFRLPITVKTIVQKALHTSFSILEQSNKDTLYAQLQAYLANGQFTTVANTKKGYVEYSLLNQSAKKVQLSVTGNALLSLPVSDINKSDGVLYTATVVDKDTSYYNFHLPQAVPDSVQVSFYPESGNLVTGITSRIGWEKKMFNSAIPTKAILYSNDKAIDTISTNDTGMGVFELQPQKGNNYYIKIINTENNTLQLIKHNLPVILEKGAVLHLPQTTSDSLLPVYITTTNSGMYSLSLRQLGNNETIIIPAFRVDKEKYFSIDMSEALRGLVQVTLLDEQGRPVAERLAFVRYEKQPIINIITNKNNYDLRDSVALNVSVNSSSGQLQDALFTVSCVHLGRTSKSNNNIVSFYYLNYWLDVAENNTCNSAAAIDTVLLIKGWRRYLWQDSSIITHPTNLKKLVITGQIRNRDRSKVKSPQTVALIRKQKGNLQMLQTDNRGFLTIPQAAVMATPEDKNDISLKVSGRGSTRTTVVQLTDPMEKVNASMPRKPFTTQNFVAKTSVQNSKDLQMEPDGSFNKTLETVVVKARNRYFANKYSLHDDRYSNYCGDYVCFNNILNCTLHPNGVPPIIGQEYYSRGEKIIYTGCAGDTLRDKIVPVYTSRGFYGMDSLILTNLDETVFMSTIYWNPFVIHNKTQAAPIKFYTSDQPGKYLIAVQGITETGEVFYADRVITVKSD